MVAQACIPSYLGGGYWEDWSLRPALENVPEISISTICRLAFFFLSYSHNVGKQGEEAVMLLIHKCTKTIHEDSVFITLSNSNYYPNEPSPNTTSGVRVPT
jgi:hypothetical protein